MDETPNAELAYRVLDHIDAHPETWDQAVWSCGAIACFAGWAVRLSGGRIEYPQPHENFECDGLPGLPPLTVACAASHLLRIGGFDADWLFFVSTDREDLGECVRKIFGERPSSDQ